MDLDLDLDKAECKSGLDTAECKSGLDKAECKSRLDKVDCKFLAQTTKTMQTQRRTEPEKLKI